MGKQPYQTEYWKGHIGKDILEKQILESKHLRASTASYIWYSTAGSSFCHHGILAQTLGSSNVELNSNKALKCKKEDKTGWERELAAQNGQCLHVRPQGCLLFQLGPGAMAEETRVYLSGIPFLMNEEWLRMHLQNSDIRRPWKVVILRRGWHRSRTQWANAFLWYNSKEEAQAVATSLDGLTLPGWWRPFKAELAWTDPNWNWLSGRKY